MLIYQLQMVDLSMVFWDCLPEGMYSYGHLSVISTSNPIYRMYNPIEITSYN